MKLTKFNCGITIHKLCFFPLICKALEVQIQTDMVECTMFMYCDLFLPDSSFIQIFWLIQRHASSCKFMQSYASLVLFFIPCPECSSLLLQSKVFFCFSSFFWSRVFFFFSTFQPSLSLCLEVASASKKLQGRQNVVISLPFLFPYIGLSSTNWISNSTNHGRRVMLCLNATGMFSVVNTKEPCIGLAMLV